MLWRDSGYAGRTPPTMAKGRDAGVQARQYALEEGGGDCPDGVPRQYPHQRYHVEDGGVVLLRSYGRPYR